MLEINQMFTPSPLPPKKNKKKNENQTNIKTLPPSHLPTFLHLTKHVSGLAGCFSTLTGVTKWAHLFDFTAPPT